MPMPAARCRRPTNGGPIECLKDLTGSNRNFVQPVASLAPTFLAAGPNGKPALACNAAANSFMLGGYTGEPGGIYAAYQLPKQTLPDSGGQGIMGGDGAAASGLGAYYLFAIGDYNTTSPPGRIGGFGRVTSDSQSTIAVLNAQTNPVMGVWTSLGMTFDGRTSRATKTATPPGRARRSGRTPSPRLSTTNAPILCADYYNHGYVNYSSAQIAALAVWKTAPAAAEYQAVSDHYNALFGMNQFAGQYLFAGFENGGGEGGGIENLLMARAASPAGPWSYVPSHLPLPAGHVIRDPSIIRIAAATC